MAQDVPLDHLLEAHVRPLRTAQSRGADSPEVAAMMAAFERGEVDETHDMIGEMMRADAARYLDWLATQPPLDRRLHLLVWPMEPESSDETAAFVIQSGPDAAEAILEAIRETGLREPAARFARVIAATRHHAAPPEDDEEAEALAELSLDFDAPGRYRREVRAALERDPEACARIAAMRAGLGEDERLWMGFALAAEAVGDAVGPAALERLDEAQRLTWLALAFEYQMDSGGLGAFFAYDCGDLAPETASALRIIGCGEAAEILQRAMALFPTPFPREAEERHDRMEDRGGKLGDRIDAMSEEIDVEAIRPGLLSRLKATNALPR